MIKDKLFLETMIRRATGLYDTIIKIDIDEFCHYDLGYSFDKSQRRIVITGHDDRYIINDIFFNAMCLDLRKAYTDEKIKKRDFHYICKEERT